MKSNFKQHCTEESIELYALGRLDAVIAEALEEHILICEPCCARLEAADTYVRAVRAAAMRLRREETEKTTTAHARTWDWLRMPAPAWGAAAVATCAVIVFSATHVRREIPGGDPVIATVAAFRSEPIALPANRKLDLTLNASGLELGPQADVELVNSGGAVLQRTTVPDLNDAVESLSPNGLQPGSYFIRLYRPGKNEPLREFALNVK